MSRVPPNSPFNEPKTGVPCLDHDVEILESVPSRTRAPLPPIPEGVLGSFPHVLLFHDKGREVRRGRHYVFSKLGATLINRWWDQELL